jgi:hypothetical protein
VQSGFFQQTFYLLPVKPGQGEYFDQTGAVKIKAKRGSGARHKLSPLRIIQVRKNFYFYPAENI